MLQQDIYWLSGIHLYLVIDSSLIAGSSPHRRLSISAMQILLKSKIGKIPKPGDNNDYVVVTFNFAKSDEIINSR